MDDNLINLGTRFLIDLGDLSNNEAGFTIEQFIAAQESTTTLTELMIDFYDYDPTPANNRRVIEPLCRCISTLRLHNAQHPLRKLTLEGMEDDSEIMKGLFAQFLVAAKQCGILHLRFIILNDPPVQYLVEFCRDNNSLKVLECRHVSFSSRAAALPLLVNNGPPNNSVGLTLDKLTLRFVSFINSTAATVFANLVAHVTVSSLELCKVAAVRNNEEEDGNDTQITERILSELKMPSAEQLTLYEDCRMEHFKDALDAGTTTVTDLDIHIESDKDDKTARLELLASFIHRAVKLNSLTIGRVHSDRPQSSLLPHLFQALEACTTVTQIKVIRYNRQYVIVPDVRPDEVQQLQKISSRNRELDRFATNPGTYRTEELPELMRQFDSSPTGRYMLARRLPGVLSFAGLHAMHLSRRRTTSPKKSKLQ